MQTTFQPYIRSKTRELRARPKIKELWYLGCQAPDQSKWFLFGSALEENPKEYEFNYPEGVPNVA